MYWKDDTGSGRGLIVAVPRHLLSRISNTVHKLVWLVLSLFNITFQLNGSQLVQSRVRAILNGELVRKWKALATAVFNTFHAASVRTDCVTFCFYAAKICLVLGSD